MLSLRMLHTERGNLPTQTGHRTNSTFFLLPNGIIKSAIVRKHLFYYYIGRCTPFLNGEIAMKVRLIATVILLCGLSLSAAISTGDGSCFTMGSKYLSGGVSFSHFGAFAAVDIGVHELLSVGAVTGFNKYEEMNGWKYSRYPVLGRVALHPLNFSFLADIILVRKSVDIYGGISAGYIYINAEWNGVTSQIGSPDASGITFGEYLGIRIALNERWHLFAENCGEMTNFAVGIGRWF